MGGALHDTKAHVSCEEMEIGQGASSTLRRPTHGGFLAKLGAFVAGQSSSWGWGPQTNPRSCMGVFIPKGCPCVMVNDDADDSCSLQLESTRMRAPKPHENGVGVYGSIPVPP